MNTLRLAVERIPFDGIRGSIDERLGVTAYVDGEQFVDFKEVVIDYPWGLLPTKMLDGEWNILTCRCGDVGCAVGDAGVVVKHETGRVKWELPRYYGIAGELGMTLEFDEVEYGLALEAVTKAGREMLVSEPATKFLLPENQNFFSGKLKEDELVTERATHKPYGERMRLGLEEARARTPNPLFILFGWMLVPLLIVVQIGIVIAWLASRVTHLFDGIYRKADSHPHRGHGFALGSRGFTVLVRLLDDLLRHVRRHFFVVRELHAEVTAPLRDRAHIGGVALDFG
jgi:hypothetical protein